MSKLELPAVLLTLVGCAVFDVPLPAQDDARALARLQRAFRATEKTKNAFTARRRAVRAMRGIDTAAAVRGLARAYTTLDAEVAPIARERRRVLREGTSLELARFRKKLDPIHELQDEILLVLAAMEGGEAADAMLGELAHAGELPLSLTLALAAHLQELRAVSVLKKALESHLGRGKRVAFLRVVRSLGPRGRMFGSWAASELADSSPTIRLEAARTLAEIGFRAALPALVDQLAKTAGRVQEAILQALERLTGQRLGASPSAWRLWLEKNIDEHGQVRPAQRGETTAGPRRTYPTYFGIPQKGDSILYVYDRSDSMERQLENGGRRIDRSRKELSRALGELPPETRFNIIAFSIKLEPWQESLVRASPDNVKSARRWLRDLDTQAATSSYDALERAFDIAGGGPDDRFSELEVETIFFLSDGEPTRRTGGMTRPIVRDDPRRILSAVRRWNATDRAVVHTIGIGLARSSALGFMQRLAEQNRGSFVAIR